jgi:hypothetical protein
MGRIDINLPLLNTGARTGVDGQRHVPAALCLGKRPDTHFTGCCVALGSVWMGPKIPDRTEFEPRTSNL